MLRMTMVIVQALLIWGLAWVLVIVATVAGAMLLGHGVGSFTHLQQRPLAAATGVAVSLLIDGLGGWRAARLAGQDEMRVAAAFGVVVMAFGATLLITAPPGATTAFDGASVLGAIPAALVGGHLARRP